MKKLIMFFTFFMITATPVLASNAPIALASSAPGTQADPLVTRSYLEQRLAQGAGAGITEELLDFLIQDITRSILATLEADAPANVVTPPTQQAPSGGYMYTPVNVLNGQTLIGGEGTEIILRAGAAVAFTEVEDGIINVTVGTELLNGSNIYTNNVLIVPRNDGRGVTVTSSNAWFIVRGPFTLR